MRTSQDVDAQRSYITVSQAIFFIADGEWKTVKEVRAFYKQQDALGKFQIPVEFMGTKLCKVNEQIMLDFSQHLAENKDWAECEWEQVCSAYNPPRYSIEQMNICLQTALGKQNLRLPDFVARLKLSIDNHKKLDDAWRSLLKVAISGEIEIEGFEVDPAEIIGRGYNNRGIGIISTNLLKRNGVNFNISKDELHFAYSVNFNSAHKWVQLKVIKEDVVRLFTQKIDNNSSVSEKSKKRWKSAFDAVQKLINGKPKITQEEALKKLFNDKHESVEKIKSLKSYKASYIQQAVMKYKF